MSAVKTALLDFLDLFVEDRSLAIAIVIWAIVSTVLFRFVPLSSTVDAVVWTVGLLTILMENVRRSAVAHNGY